MILALSIFLIRGITVAKPRLLERRVALAQERGDRSMLVTTGYWKIKSKQGSPANSDKYYVDRMSTVMGLNSSMHIYGDEHGLSVMVEARRQSDIRSKKPDLLGKSLVSVDDLPPCSSHWEELTQHPAKFTHPWHLPSIELGCIWSGKLAVMKRAADQHPYFDWYSWVDVGLNWPSARASLTNRTAMWPDPLKLKGLPADKVVVAQSESPCWRCTAWENCHCVAGTAFAVPKARVNEITKLFSEYQDRCFAHFSSNNSTGAFVCLSDQVVLTRVAQARPELFWFVPTEGYGEVVTFLL